MGAKRSQTRLRILTKQLHELIQPHGGTLQGARFLVETKSVKIEEARRRIELMKQAGIKGVTRNLGASKRDFEEMIKRKKGVGVERLSPKQKASYMLLIMNEILPEQAIQLATIKGVNVSSFEKRLAVLKRKLDFSKYGVNRLPSKLYSQLIHLDSYRMQKPLRAKILRPLENANARRILYVAFPQWKKMKHVYGLIEARTVLAKLEYLLEKGKMPYEKYLRQYSLEQLPTVIPSIEPIDPKLSEWILSKIKQARKEGLNKAELEWVLQKLKKVEIPENNKKLG